MKKILSTRVLVKICVLTTILLVLIIYTIWGNSALMVSMVNISSDRIASAFSNFRIAQVSDLHNAEFGESNTELIELLSEHEPDIIVITGDLIDAGHTDIEIAFDFVKQAVQIAPVYFVTGNHEANFSHYDQFKTGLEASGVTVLEDEAIQLVHNNEMITLIGLSDSDFTIKGDMFNEAPAMVNTKLNSLIDDENSYTILLSHRPELFETYVCCGVDLVLCGHAHGGQFRLPFIGGLVAPNQGLFPKYDSGLYTDGKTNMVVSRGLGNSIIPFRFNNRPEVILNSVYTRSGQNSTPNSNATNLHSSQKRCCSFCISSSNASPTFQVQKSIFHQMTKPIQVTVILPLLLAISFSWNDDIHSSISGISNDLIGVIPTIGQ